MLDLKGKFARMNRRGTHRATSWQKTLAMISLFLLAVLFLMFVVTKTDVIIMLALVLVIFLVVALFYWPEPGTIIVIFVIYTNLAVVAYKFHGLPQIVAASVSLVLCVPLVVYWFLRREPFLVDYPWLLMIVFLGSLCASLLAAKDIALGLDWILTFVLEGLAMYLLILNVVRKYSTLRSVIWSLLIAGGLLGSLSLIQEATHSYKNNFGGLAQRNLKNWEDGKPSAAAKFLGGEEKIRVANRAGGPFGGANRYAQIMVVLLPLGLFRIIDEKKGTLKFAAFALTLLILTGVLLTYSRGAFITLFVLVLLAIVFRYFKFYQVILAATVLLLVVGVASPGYFTRMESILNATALFSNDASIKADGATRGRVTEMLAAFNAFLDYPIVGVGPGQYTKYYSVEYMSNPEIAFKDIKKTRRAHTLYFELMAETGFLGLATFMSIVLYILFRLWLLRQRFRKTRPELANIATAFWMSIVAYLVSAVFLQLAYQRYYWLLLALAGAAIQILSTEFPADENEEPVSRRRSHLKHPAEKAAAV